MKRKPYRKPTIFASRVFTNAGRNYIIYGAWVPNTQIAEILLYGVNGRALESFCVAMQSNKNKAPGRHLRNKLTSLEFRGDIGSELYYIELQKIKDEAAGVAARQHSCFLKK